MFDFFLNFSTVPHRLALDLLGLLLHDDRDLAHLVCLVKEVVEFVVSLKELLEVFRGCVFGLSEGVDSLFCFVVAIDREQFLAVRFPSGEAVLTIIDLTSLLNSLVRL